MTKATGYMTIEEAASAAGMSHWAIRKAITRGALPATHEGRFVRIRRADFDAWKVRKQPPGNPNFRR